MFIDSLLPFNYASATHRKSVVVLYAGPSTKNNSDRINEYIQINDSVVIGANYSYESIGIKSDYTYVANDFKLVENCESIKNDIIIPAKIFIGEINPKHSRKILRRHISKGYNVFINGKEKDKTTYSLKSGVIEMKKDGSLPYSRLSSAGHGCMFLSMVIRPEKVLFVGLDGPTDITCEKKIMFNGKTQKYGKPQKNENFKQHFVNVVLPSLFSKGILIETFSDVVMYGLDKEKLKIGVINV